MNCCNFKIQELIKRVDKLEEPKKNDNKDKPLCNINFSEHRCYNGYCSLCGLNYCGVYHIRKNICDNCKVYKEEISILYKNTNEVIFLKELCQLQKHKRIFDSNIKKSKQYKLFELPKYFISNKDDDIDFGKRIFKSTHQSTHIIKCNIIMYGHEHKYHNRCVHCKLHYCSYYYNNLCCSNCKIYRGEINKLLDDDDYDYDKPQLFNNLQILQINNNTFNKNIKKYGKYKKYIPIELCSNC